ncbi:hypothetical protein [Paenibacillus thiaminolyticus]|uniref:hypothetical protein n=1 Tax=Paenibacillus thiaminolyticus TaxID=49283 RepID=UPI002542E0DB|nr:hypothetical protein [Paenibacillus thiaminolyticus]WII37234.1 hypothetical protein O0V01_27230 [Paenibacillus thiaminolyticus]
MIIYIDNVPRSYDIQSEEEMNASWIDITKEFMSNGQILSSVVIDDVVYYDSYASELLTRYDKINTVKITTITKEQSFFMTLQEFQEYSGKVMSSMGDYIQPLYSGSMETSKDILPIITESVQWVVSALSYIQHVSQEVKVDPLIQDIINHAVEKFMPIVKLLLDEIESENTIGFADLINYEFIPLVEEFYHKSKGLEITSLPN